jgi:phosphopantothenoylcysteine decarboxylase / phosphopantothenate---cysteine ligase
MNGKSVLIIIGGGIAAYKSLELIRRLKERNIAVRAVLTDGGAHFVTEVSLTALTGAKVYRDMFELTGDGVRHIQLSREADLVVVAPATADLMAKMAAGLAGDLASALLLAADKKVLLAPSMNVKMWDNPATRRNVATLKGDGILFVGPDAGDLACGEKGTGRMAEPEEILAAIEAQL